MKKIILVLSVLIWANLAFGQNKIKGYLLYTDSLGIVHKSKGYVIAKYEDKIIKTDKFYILKNNKYIKIKNVFLIIPEYE